MNYENAPATKMLATHCAVCRRPLVDSVSVELGIGPECRKRHGYTDGMNGAANDAVRREANHIVWAVAAEHIKGAEIGTALARLKWLGFGKLAQIIGKRLATVEVSIDGGRLVVRAPYSDIAVAGFRLISGRRFDTRVKAWTFPTDDISRARVWRALRVGYPGAIGVGPKGVFFISEGR